MGLAFGRRDLLESWRPYKVRPAANEPVGHRFELGTSQHELLAGFVAAVDYIDSHRLGRDPRARARARRTLLSGLPDDRLYGLRTMEGRVPTFCFNVPGHTPKSVRDSSPSATSPSGTATTTRSRHAAPRARRTARFGRGSSTTTPRTRSTACSSALASSREAPRSSAGAVPRPRRRGCGARGRHELTFFNRGRTNP